MTLDTQFRARLTSAVDDTTVPPGLAGAVLVGGRRRRRRRTTGGLALVTTAVVGGVMLIPMLGGSASGPGIASGGNREDPVAFAWAGSLPQGDDPALPYFADDALWSGGAGLALPASVNVSVGPWAVDGGWIVMTGKNERELAWAMLTPDGGLRDLPAETYSDGLGMARFDVSPDGRQAVTGQWLVDVASMTATRLPHAPPTPDADGYLIEVRPAAFTDQGLVYEAAPFVEGIGVTYLLRPDGSTVAVDLPPSTHIPDGSPGDIAVAYDYASDNSDTCVTSHRLRDAQWSEDGTGCMGKSLGEGESISPDGRWLITDDLPRVWDLEAGEFATIDLPRDVVTSRGDDLVSGLVWESDDSFLLPVADRTLDYTAGRADFDQSVRVVRCRMSTGACELAVSVENRVVAGPMASTAFRFATS